MDVESGSIRKHKFFRQALMHLTRGGIQFTLLSKTQGWILRVITISTPFLAQLERFTLRICIMSSPFVSNPQQTHRVTVSDHSLGW